MKLKTIIVDDEVDGANVLKILISKSGKDINVVGIAHNLLDAVDLIKEHKPQLVFLDVEMPGHSGYEIVDFFEEIDFSIIFVTAYDEYAVKAFEINAVDYLLKPINRQRLYEAVDKVSSIEQDKVNRTKYLQLVEAIQAKETPKLILNELSKRHVVLLPNIIAIEAQGAYSKIYLLDREVMLVSKNLGYFEEAFPAEHSFIRTHKSWLVNKDCVESFEKKNGVVFLKNNITAKLSKYKKVNFEKEINS